MMPWRALIIFGFGAFLVYANMPDAEAEHGTGTDGQMAKCRSQTITGSGWGYASSARASCEHAGDDALSQDLYGCNSGFHATSVTVGAYLGNLNFDGTYTCSSGNVHDVPFNFKYEWVGAHGCTEGEVIDPDTGACVGEDPPPECSAQQGQSMTCEYTTTEPGDGGCHLGCTITTQDMSDYNGVTVAGVGGKFWKRYVFTGQTCEPVETPYCGDHDPGDGGYGPAEDLPFGDTGSSMGPDGGGTHGGEEFPPPPSSDCVYTDGGLIVCDDSSAAGGAGADDDDDDLSGETDNSGDGEADDGFTVSNDWPSATPGSTIVDSETGDPLGTAIDQDGDGFTDGIDTDGDGDIDVDDPTDPGGGCDNNGDGVCDANDGDNDGDGKPGQAGDCIDDPETEENECDGTGAGGGASVAGLSCNDEPQCQPDKEDPQGTLWCAQLKLQHQVSCQYHVDEAEGNPESLLSDKPEDDGSELWQETDLESEGPGLSTSVVSAAGGCYQDLEFTVLGQTFAVPLSVLCPYFDAAGMIVLIVGYMVAGFVVYRGVFA